MPQATTETKFPLREIREGCKLGVTEATRLGQAITPYFPASPEALLNIERRGTVNHHIIVALATIYRQPESRIAALADPANYRAN